MTKKLPPHEAWDAIEDMVLDDEAERVAKMSRAELDRDLAAKGLDPKAVRARGEALVARLQAAKSGQQVPARAPSPSPNVVPLRPARRTPFSTYSMWAAIAASILAIIGGFTAQQISNAHHKDDHPTPWDAGPQEHAGRREAAAIRDRAISLCEQGARRQCESLLDSAKALDPEGERTDPRVADWRAKILELSTHPPKDEKGLHP
jgi:hypothetical protein